MKKYIKYPLIIVSLLLVLYGVMYAYLYNTIVTSYNLVSVNDEYEIKEWEEWFPEEFSSEKSNLAIYEINIKNNSIFNVKNVEFVSTNCENLNVKLISLPILQEQPLTIKRNDTFKNLFHYSYYKNMEKDRMQNIISDNCNNKIQFNVGILPFELKIK